MVEPRIDSIRYSYSRERKKPKAGDERFLKGRQVWQIRQQEVHRGMSVVTRHGPVWEWVDKGSDRDREHQEALRRAERAAKAGQ